jgi:hypothetical protein
MTTLQWLARKYLAAMAFLTNWRIDRPREASNRSHVALKTRRTISGVAQDLQNALAVIL